MLSRTLIPLALLVGVSTAASDQRSHEAIKQDTLAPQVEFYDGSHTKTDGYFVDNLTETGYSTHVTALVYPDNKVVFTLGDLSSSKSMGNQASKGSVSCENAQQAQFIADAMNHGKHFQIITRDCLENSSGACTVDTPLAEIITPEGGKTKLPQYVLSQISIALPDNTMTTLPNYFLSQNLVQMMQSRSAPGEGKQFAGSPLSRKSDPKNDSNGYFGIQTPGSLAAETR